jgi:hypothetical protein
MLEPKEGIFDFSDLDKIIDIWSKGGKTVILRVISYGQTDGNAATPQWVKDSLPVITFSSSKEKRGDVVIPKVWDEKFLVKYKNFVKALAEHYDSDPRVKYIQIGVGHIGYVNAQPSKEGANAFLDAGWTLDIWGYYVKKVIDIYADNFKNKKLIIAIEPIFMRDYYLINNIEAGKNIVRYAASKDYDISFIGVEVDNEKFEQTGIPTIVEDLFSMNINNFSVGFGDDWPCIGQTGSKVRTEEDCQEILNNIYNLWVSAGKKYPIFLKVLDNELAASEPGNSKFDKNLYNIFVDFINKVRMKNE